MEARIDPLALGDQVETSLLAGGKNLGRATHLLTLELGGLEFALQSLTGASVALLQVRLGGDHDAALAGRFCHVGQISVAAHTHHDAFDSFAATAHEAMTGQPAQIARATDVSGVTS